MKKQPLISVVVPIYNGEKYLEKCIQSLLYQAYNRLEIILVDDGSVDRSLQICKSYAESNRQIKVFHQNNLGRVKARKEGVRIAMGEYISFVDADDWVDKNIYEILIEYLQNSPDMVAFGLKEEYSVNTVERKNTIQNGVYKDKEIENLYSKIICSDVFFECGILPHLCDKIIKKDLLERSGFFEINEKITYGEDMLATFQCCLNAKSIVVTDITPYHYSQNNYINGLHQVSIEMQSICSLYQGLMSNIKGNLYYEVLNKQISLYMWFVLILNKLEEINKNQQNLLFPYGKMKEDPKVVIYGAGGLGISVYRYLSEVQSNSIAAWVDKNYRMPEKKKLGIESVDRLKDKKFDYVIVAMLNEKIAKDITENLVEMGIERGKIYYITKRIIEEVEIPKWLSEGECYD